MIDRPELLEYTLGTGVRAFTTTRLGGCSEGTYASFNINEYCGDRPDHIRANRAALCHALGIGPEALILPHQVHGTTVREVNAALLRHDAATRHALLEGVDAVMTDVAGVCVGVSTADCLPILLHDPEHHAACAVHAGWRGTVARIAQRAVAAMAEAYSTRPDALRAALGPCISLECFEVGDEVYQEFAEAGFPMQRISRREAKWHIDLAECNRLQLAEAGLDPQSVAVSGLCTYSRPDDFFSARRLGAASGRLFSGIMLRGGATPAPR